MRSPLHALAAALVLACVAPLSAAAGSRAATDSAAWRTLAERSGYRVTPDYGETMRYCRRLEAASPWIKVTSYGTSGQGRDLPLVIVSRDRAFTPAAARRTGKPIVLIQNGIHSGEIEGKDASLALLRDIAIHRTQAHLLDHAILLVLPIFSVDAHERRSRFNRINQNGPDEMGWRATPIGLNLNRDYMKAEAPEMRALIGGVFTRWWPHLLVDDHTTDGADFQHDLTYGINHGPGTPAPVARWLAGAFEGRVLPRLEAMGHVTAPYLTFRAEGNPRSGISFEDSSPRFSTGYAPIQCRPAVLVETHMLKPYATRVRATYDLLVALLEEVNAHPDSLVSAVADAEAEVVARGREPSPLRRRVVLSSRLTGASVPFRFHGFAFEHGASPITGTEVVRYSTTPWDTIIPLFRDLEPALVVEAPIGYVVPREWTTVIDRLALHGVVFRRFSASWTDSVEVEHIIDWSTEGDQREGHHPTRVSRIVLERRLATAHPGDAWVPCDQRAGLVAVHLLEAEAPDGMMYWNAFDTVLLHKEYAEDYVMDPLARRMLATDPALQAGFRARLAADSSFAASPSRRIDFFYRNSPWADPEQDLNPVRRALRPPPAAVLERR